MTSVVDTFYAIDFDRCLGNVDACHGLLQEVISDKKLVDVGEFSRAREHVRTTGETFLVFEYLRKVGSPENVQGITDEFIRRGQATSGRLLESGAQELIDWLRAAHKNFGIITHGEHEWQVTKITAAGLGNVPRMVVGHRNKAQYIVSWQGDDGIFTISEELLEDSPISAREVVLIDDRALAFEGLPDAARGYWVVIDGEAQPFQQGTIPANVTEVHRISDIIDYEK